MFLLLNNWSEQINSMACPVWMTPLSIHFIIFRLKYYKIDFTFLLYFQFLIYKDDSNTTKSFFFKNPSFSYFQKIYNRIFYKDIAVLLRDKINSLFHTVRRADTDLWWSIRTTWRWIYRSETVSGSEPCTATSHYPAEKNKIFAFCKLFSQSFCLLWVFEKRTKNFD